MPRPVIGDIGRDWGVRGGIADIDSTAEFPELVESTELECECIGLRN
jgi:hypothetical protein